MLDRILYTLINISNRTSYKYVYIHEHNTVANSHILSMHDSYYLQSSSKAMISIDVVHCSIKGRKIGINSLKMALSCRNMSEQIDLYIINALSYYTGPKCKSK